MTRRLNTACAFVNVVLLLLIAAMAVRADLVHWTLWRVIS